jgi:dTDP-4-dehydrorhamnose reductase
MKVLVLGKNGMLGHVVYTYFHENGYDTVGTLLEGDGIIYDAFKNQDYIEEIIKEQKPDVIINCIGILNQVAENNHVLAIKLNSLLPQYIDSLSEKYKYKFIHISTDCVFIGTKGKYSEKDNPDTNTFYGKSKALGEVNNNRSLTLRTSIVGPDENPSGIGLFQWFMNQQKEVGGYTKVIWTGVTTIELARAIEKAIKNNLTGLHHVVNNNFISKYDLLKLFADKFKKNINIYENEDVISEKTLIRTEQSFDFNVPSYRKMVEDMYDWVFNHKELYPSLINIIENKE